MALTVIHVDGAEADAVVASTGAGALISSQVGTTIEATIVKNGSGSYKVVQPGSGTAQFITPIGGSPTKIMVGFYFYVGALPSSGTMGVLRTTCGGASFPGLILTSAGQLQVVSDTGAGTGATNVGSALSTGTWYYIEYRADISTGTWTIGARIDEGTETTITPSISASTFSNVLFGNGVSTSITSTFYYDDIYVGTYTTGASDYLGKHYVKGQKIDAVGTHNLDAATSLYYKDETNTALTTSETTSYQKVDEDNMSQTSDYIKHQPNIQFDNNITPDAILAQSGWTGTIVITTIDEDPDSPSGDWAVAASNTADPTVRVSFPTPAHAPYSGQGITVDIYVRKNGGTGTPTVQIDLYESGSLVLSGSAQDVTSGTGQKLSQLFTGWGTLSDPTGAGLEALITVTHAGGGPSARASVDLDAVNIQSSGWLGYAANTTYVEYTTADTAESPTPRAVGVAYGVHDSAGGGGLTTMKIFANSAEATVYAGSTSAALNICTGTFDQAPGSTAWTTALVNGIKLRFGYPGVPSSAFTDLRLHSAVVQVLYPEAAASTVTFDAAIAGTGAVTPGLAATRNLAVTPAGLGAVSPSLATTRTLAVDVAGLGAVAAAKSITRSLAADIAGLGALTADLSKIREFAADIAGLGSVVADLVRSVPLLASITGLGAATADLNVSRSLQALITGVGDVAPALSASRPLQVDVAGVGVVTVDLGSIRTFAMVANGVGLVSIDMLAIERNLAAVIAGLGSVQTDLAATRTLEATVAGLGVVTTDLAATRPLATDIAGIGAVVTDMTVSGGTDVFFDAVIAGLGALSADLQVSRALEVAVAGAGVVGVNWAVTRSLATAIAGNGVVSAEFVRATQALAVAIAGTGAVTGDFGRTVNLEITSSGLAVVTADLKTRTRLEVASSGLGAVTADFVRTETLAATIAGLGAVSPTLIRTVPISVAIAGIGLMNADLIIVGSAPETIQAFIGIHHYIEMIEDIEERSPGRE